MQKNTPMSWKKAEKRNFELKQNTENPKFTQTTDFRLETHLKIQYLTESLILSWKMHQIVRNMKK